MNLIRTLFRFGIKTILVAVSIGLFLWGLSDLVTVAGLLTSIPAGDAFGILVISGLFFMLWRSLT